MSFRKFGPGTAQVTTASPTPPWAASRVRSCDARLMEVSGFFEGSEYTDNMGTRRSTPMFQENIQNAQRPPSKRSRQHSTGSQRTSLKKSPNPKSSPRKLQGPCFMGACQEHSGSPHASVARVSESTSFFRQPRHPRAIAVSQVMSPEVQKQRQFREWRGRPHPRA